MIQDTQHSEEIYMSDSELSEEEEKIKLTSQNDSCCIPNKVIPMQQGNYDEKLQKQIQILKNFISMQNTELLYFIHERTRTNHRIAQLENKIENLVSIISIVQEHPVQSRFQEQSKEEAQDLSTQRQPPEEKPLIPRSGTDDQS